MFCLFFFFFNDTATTEIYTLSLHDALPICVALGGITPPAPCGPYPRSGGIVSRRSEEHTSELQSSQISYAVFCLKKKKQWSDTHTRLPEHRDELFANDLRARPQR